MAKKAMINKQQRAPKFSTRAYTRCSICGRKGKVHHWDAIGMGNDRKHYDDSTNRKICLCREHHTLAHSYGRERVMQVYHVFGVYYMDGSQDDIEKNRKGGRESEY